MKNTILTSIILATLIGCSTEKKDGTCDTGKLITNSAPEYCLELMQGNVPVKQICNDSQDKELVLPVGKHHIRAVKYYNPTMWQTGFNDTIEIQPCDIQRIYF
jgi:hypothetical protein